MEISLKINTERDSLENTINIVKHLFKINNNSNQNQSKLENNTISSNNNDVISIVVRDGAEKKTVDVKEDLKELGFNYYAKLKSGKSDPRWTQTCNTDKWMRIQNSSILENLNVWTSQEGDAQ